MHVATSNLKRVTLELAQYHSGINYADLDNAAVEMSHFALYFTIWVQLYIKRCYMNRRSSHSYIFPKRSDILDGLVSGSIYGVTALLTSCQASSSVLARFSQSHSIEVSKLVQ